MGCLYDSGISGTAKAGGPGGPGDSEVFDPKRTIARDGHVEALALALQQLDSKQPQASTNSTDNTTAATAGSVDSTGVSSSSSSSSSASSASSSQSKQPISTTTTTASASTKSISVDSTSTSGSVENKHDVKQVEPSVSAQGPSKQKEIKAGSSSSSAEEVAESDPGSEVLALLNIISDEVAAMRGNLIYIYIYLFFPESNIA